MNIYKKRIGIWGFGIVGKSIAAFLRSKNSTVDIMEKRLLSDDEKTILQKQSIYLVDEQHCEKFLTSHDIIIPSAGIDLRAYQQYHHKCITELDLFSHFFSKPIIAITGTVGKTTLTNLLTATLTSQGAHIAMGGNIGVGLCDLIADQSAVDYAVLEVSSFQLELSKIFAPDLAIWTNFYPNHLDRHTTLDDYFTAKLNILRYQQPHQKALVALELLPLITQSLATIAPTISFFSRATPPQEIFEKFPDNRFFWIEHDTIVTRYRTKKSPLIALDQLPHGIFIDTALMLTATLTILNRPCTVAHDVITTSTAIEHRLEKVASINGVTFYNDSKATVPEATLAAVTRLQPGPILLLLGGLSKGVDRKPFIKQLKNKISHAFCFGGEAEQLHQWCTEYAIEASLFDSLETAFDACMVKAQPGDSILLSPGGSSFDLFKNYQERGNRFKQLVKNLS